MKFVKALFATLAAAVAVNAGNNTNDNCDTCGGYAPVDIASWCAQYDGWSQSCCQCIVQHESGGNSHACNKNTNGSIDVGLWQVNSCNWDACNGGNPPCDPSANLYCAIKVFNWGSNTWKYWSTCGACGCCGSA